MKAEEAFRAYLQETDVLSDTLYDLGQLLIREPKVCVASIGEIQSRIRTSTNKCEFLYKEFREAVNEQTK